MPLTTHAKKRVQQRGISESLVDILLDFGTYQCTHTGVEVVFLKNHDKLLVAGFLGQTQLSRQIGKTYLVINRAGGVITVGHRSRRIKTH
jgi:hypothetical protein